jgi:hypothetical protein
MNKVQTTFDDSGPAPTCSNSYVAIDLWALLNFVDILQDLTSYLGSLLWF